MGNAEQVQRQIAEEIKPNLASSTKGLVVAQDWDNGFVTVSVGGTEQRLGWEGTAPWPGNTVRIKSNGGAVWCMAVYGAPMGTVQSTGSGFATVLGDDSVTYTYPHLGSAPAGASRVRLDHAGRCVLSGTYSVEPANSEFIRPPAPPPPSGSSGGEAWFIPAWSGNWNPGFQGSEVTVSSSRTGLYGYGTQIRDTIPDDRTLTVCQLHLVKTFESPNTTTVNSSMGTHSHNSPPGSASDADLSGTYLKGPNDAVIDLLGVVGDALKTGAAFGVGFRSGSNGWRTWAATPSSGRIFARWV